MWLEAFSKLLLRLLSQQQELSKNSLLSNTQVPNCFSNNALQLQDLSSASNNFTSVNGANNIFYFHPAHRLEEGISVWNPVTLEIVGCNDQFQRMIGSPYSELSSRKMKLFELTNFDKQEALRENLLQKINDGMPKVAEMVLEMKRPNNEIKNSQLRMHFENGFLWCVHKYI